MDGTQLYFDETEVCCRAKMAFPFLRPVQSPLAPRPCYPIAFYLEFGFSGLRLLDDPRVSMILEDTRQAARLLIDICELIRSGAGRVFGIFRSDCRRAANNRRLSSSNTT